MSTSITGKNLKRNKVPDIDIRITKQGIEC